MGAFYVKCKIENPVDRTRSAIISKLLVDTGSEYSWVPERTLERIGIRREKKDIAFVLANGQQVTRSVGFAIIRLDKFFTIDEVVFAEPNDLQLLGARTLEGLNLSIEPAQRRLVASGPLPAASPTRARLTSAPRRTGRRRWPAAHPGRQALRRKGFRHRLDRGEGQARERGRRRRGHPLHANRFSYRGKKAHERRGRACSL